jgi:hypothetical protein
LGACISRDEKAMTTTHEMIEALERDFIAGLSDQDIERRLAEIRASLPDVERAYDAGWINAAKWAERPDLISDMGCTDYGLDKQDFLRGPAVAYTFTPVITGSAEPLFDAIVNPDGETCRIVERGPAVATPKLHSIEELYAAAAKTSGPAFASAPDAERAALRKDAERWRKLRAMRWSDGKGTLVVTRMFNLPVGATVYTAERLDEAIDAAMKEDSDANQFTD